MLIPVRAFLQTHQWMEHQHTGRKLLQIPTSDDMAKALEALPQNFAKLPGQVSHRRNLLLFVQYICCVQAAHGHPV